MTDDEIQMKMLKENLKEKQLGKGCEIQEIPKIQQNYVSGKFLWFHEVRVHEYEYEYSLESESLGLHFHLHFAGHE